MKLEIVVSEPWELTQSDTPARLIAEVEPGAGLDTVQLESERVTGSLNGIAIGRVELSPYFEGHHFRELETGEVLAVSGTAFPALAAMGEPFWFLGSAQAAP